MEHVTGLDLQLAPNHDRGYTPTEISVALRIHGWAMSMYECELEIALPQRVTLTMEERLRKKFLRWKKKIESQGVRVRIDFVQVETLDLAPTDNCMVEIPNHALAYIDGKYFDAGVEVPKPDRVLSYWVPTRIKSDENSS